MEFRILGPLEVINGDRVALLASAKERSLLALLLLEPNRVVPTERLIDQLWDGRAPATAATSLRVLVSRLRKTLSVYNDTEVIVTHEHIASEELRKMHEQGWFGCLEGLARFVEGK